MNNLIFFIFSFSFIAFSINKAFANTRSFNPESSNILASIKPRYTENSKPVQDFSEDVYRKKHNLDSKKCLHPSRTDLLSSDSTQLDDDFLVIYPQGYKKESNKKVEEPNMPLLLGSIGSGLYSEANPSLELFPGSLSSMVDSVYNYLGKMFSNMNRSLHNFFDAIDENLKKSNGLPVIELGDVLF